ncbi:hypothetical protein BDF21DRAFT_450820 [Thamnidium elegans]|nr:hypothetical protein BDF21DRAFT_450820 [Thamnidium elegans]
MNKSITKGSGTQWSLRNSSCTNSLCGICRSESETNEHFFVSCFHKWTLWKKAIEDMNLKDTFPSPETVWIALFTLHDKTCQQIPEDILLSLGTVLEIIWHYHWRCIFDQSFWIDQQAITLFEMSISRSLISIDKTNDITTE